MSDEENIYIFPDDIPVNIANPKDLIRLREIFCGRELYFVAGSDVIENASCYRVPPSEGSIHSMNHIIFKRSSDERRDASAGETPYPISGDVINLHLEEYFEDISSTRIRENIDSFVTRSLLRFRTEGEALAAGVAGSIGTACRKWLEEAGQEYGISFVRFIPSPIEALVRYHSGKSPIFAG